VLSGLLAPPFLSTPDPFVAFFYIRPGYDMSHPRHSPTGGYVVTGDVDEPYTANLDEVWLVQKPLFESTYEVEE
jgi:hypothetical protein